MAQYTAALKTEPNNAELLASIATNQFWRGRTDSAVASMERANALDPRSPERAFGLGRAYEFAKRYPAAVAAYDRAIALAPDQYHAYYDKARTLISWQGDVAGARAAMQQAEARIGRLELVKKMCVACFDWTGPLAAGRRLRARARPARARRFLHPRRRQLLLGGCTRTRRGSSSSGWYAPGRASQTSTTTWASSTPGWGGCRMRRGNTRDMRSCAAPTPTRCGCGPTAATTGRGCGCCWPIRRGARLARGGAGRHHLSAHHPGRTAGEPPLGAAQGQSKVRRPDRRELGAGFAIGRDIG